MARNKDLGLELFAFDLNESQWDDVFVYLLDVPAAWRDFIKQLSKDRYLLPRKISPLGTKIQSIFADIIWVNNSFHIDQKGPWIIATNPIDPGFLIPLSQYWFTQLAEKEKIDPPAKVNIDQLVWKKVRVSDVRDEYNRYSIIPALVANHFCQNPKILTDQTGTSLELKFTQTFTANQAECMSQPIEREQGYYSYVIRFRLKNRGGQADRPLLLVTCGIRRFVTDPVQTQFLKGKINSSILVSLAHPFLSNRGIHSPSFAKLTFRRKGNSQPYTRWNEGLDELFWDVLYGKQFSSEDVLTNPTEYWNNQEVHAMIIHNNQLFGSHPIGPGASKGEKNSLFDMVKEELNQMTSLTPLQYINDPFTKRKTKGQPALPMFHIPSYYKKIKLEIWGPQDLFQVVKDVLGEEKEKKKPIAYQFSSNIFRINGDRDLLIEIVHNQNSSFTESLETEKYIDQAYDVRAQNILDQLGKTRETIISLIEIPPKSVWEKNNEEESDPKDAIREGFRRSGRLTQFIHPITEPKRTKRGKIIEGAAEKERKYRVERSLLDLFSDLGFLNMEVYSKLPNDRPIYAYDVWKVESLNPTSKKTSVVYYPFLTRLHDGDLAMKGMGIEDWKPINKAILQCNLYQHLKSDNNSYKKATHWLDEQMMKEVLNNHQPLLIVDTDLRNNWLKGIISNPKIKLEINPEFAEWTPTDKRLNVIRINTTEDVPSYRYHPEVVSESFSPGIFYDEAGMYYGIGAKPLAMRGIAKIQTKYDFPDLAFQQPQAVEYMPLGFSEIEQRHQVAWLTHHLRELAVSYELTTILPYPLKIMKSVQKYLKKKGLSQVWIVEPELVEWI